MHSRSEIEKDSFVTMEYLFDAEEWKQIPSYNQFIQTFAAGEMAEDDIFDTFIASRI